MNIEILEGELWKEVPGLNGYYLASNIGRIYSVSRQFKMPLRNGEIQIRKSPGRMLNQFTDFYGYKRVQISIEGKKQKMKVHRLVCEAFYGSPLPGQVTNHINGVKNDNRVENLEWVSNRENSLHGHRNKKNGLPPGIYFHPSRNRFQGAILVGKKRHQIGDCKTLEEAIQAYENKLKSLGIKNCYSPGLDLRC